MRLCESVILVANFGLGPVAGLIEAPWIWAYVVIALIAETVAIGLAFRLGIWRSFAIVLAANVVTALLGVLPFCIFGVNLFWSGQPFLELLQILFGLGTLSALVEALVWRRFIASRVAYWRHLRPCLAAHWITGALMLGIVLAQARPYRHVEDRISVRRKLSIRLAIQSNFREYFETNETLPDEDRIRTLLQNDGRGGPHVHPYIEFDRFGRITTLPVTWTIDRFAPGRSRVDGGTIAVGTAGELAFRVWMEPDETSGLVHVRITREDDGAR